MQPLDITDVVQQDPLQGLAPMLVEAQTLSDYIKGHLAKPDSSPDLLLNRTADLLLEMRLHVELLSNLVEYTALKVRALTDVQPDLKQPISRTELVTLLETLPDTVDVGEMLYLLVRKVEQHHKIPGA